MELSRLVSRTRRARPHASSATARLLPWVLIAACGGEPAPREVTLRFVARAGTQAVSCASGALMLGQPPRAMRLGDLRFFVSGVRAVDRAGREHSVELVDDGKWQRGGAALVDLEDKAGACAESGTVDVNDQVRGRTAAPEIAGVRFVLGLPPALNHQSPATAASPFNLLSMHWSWQAGYKFLRLEFDADGAGPGWLVHVGSAGCMSSAQTEPPTTECRQPNRATISLTSFDPARQRIAVDIAALLAGSDLSRNTANTAPGCMAEVDDPDCAPVFARLGLSLATGQCEGGCAGQALFRAE